MYHVYVLKSENNDFHYIGHSHNLTNRVHEHNRGKVRSTKAFRPFNVIYTEQYSNKSEATKREMYLKTAEGNIWLRNYLLSLGKW